MSRLALTFAFLLALVGCGPRYVDYFPRHDDGTLKPHVAFLPIRNCTHDGLPWNVSEELTDGVRYQIMQNGNLFFFSPSVIAKAQATCGECDFFNMDLSFAKNFCGADFVVVSDLIEHGYVPYERGKFNPLYPANCNVCRNVLSMKVRIRIIDVRRDCPKIVLQEVFCSNHMIPANCETVDFSTCYWGSPSYPTSPIGMAHSRLIADLSRRIETITCNAR